MNLIESYIAEMTAQQKPTKASKPRKQRAVKSAPVAPAPVAPAPVAPAPVIDAKMINRLAQQETGYGPNSIIWGKTTREIIPDLIQTIETMRDTAIQETLTDAAEHALAVCRQILAREAYNESKALMWKELKSSK